MHINSIKIRTLAGFTLLEILIAMLIFGVTLTTLYSTYTATIRNIEKAKFLAETYRKARVALERITEDLESAYLTKATTDTTSELGFYGKDLELEGRSSDSIQFTSSAHLVFNEETHSLGRARLNYYVSDSEDDEGFLLFRSDTMELDNNFIEAEGGLILCDNLYSVDFIYYDENGDTYEEWDSTSDLQKNKMPSRISVSLVFANEDDEPSQKFQTDVAIPLVNEKI